VLSAIHQTLSIGASRLGSLWALRAHAELVLEPCYPGLGDHLLFSHLPRIAKQTGIAKQVFVSKLSPCSDPEYLSLVWQSNPHVDGFIDVPGFRVLLPHTNPDNARWWETALQQFGIVTRIALARRGCNLLDELMLACGLDDGERYHEPELHMRISRRPEYEGLVVFDPNYVTNPGRITLNSIVSFLKSERIYLDAQLAPRNHVIELPRPIRRIKTRSLTDFCSLIVSCKQLYCFTTGTAALAAALGKHCTVLYGQGVNPMYHHSRMHRYVRL